VGVLLWEMFTGKRLFYGKTDYQTVELVRQTRIPSMSAINPDITPELEAIVRKALAHDPDDRYQDAADLGDALAQFLFSHRMKVTARDIASLVREVQQERARKRSMGPQNELIDVLIRDEMAKVTSLVDGDDKKNNPTSAGSLQLDPNSFVNTGGWVDEFGLGTDLGSSASPLPAATPEPTEHESAAASSSHRLSEVAPDPVEVGSLQDLLEPDRSSVENTDDGSNAIMIALAVLILLVAGLGVAVFVFRDKLFG